MLLQLKPHSWSCLATSFAMALDIPVRLFELMAGHDGSEIMFPELSEPLCRRGFHVSEATLIAMRLGYSATPLELFPQIAASAGPSVKPVYYGQTATEEFNWTIFEATIISFSGVIEARTKSPCWHAVAFDKGQIFDPDGRQFAYSREDCARRGLFTTRLWRVTKIAT